MSYSEVLEKLYSLRRDKRGDHERPHKPALILALLDLGDAGLIADGRIPLDSTLINTWRSYFDIVKASNDQPTAENPIYRLSGDHVWSLKSIHDGSDIYWDGDRNQSPTLRWMKDNVQHAELDQSILEIIESSSLLTSLRTAIVSRYFSEHTETLFALSMHTVAALSAGRRIPKKAEEDREAREARDGAFRKLVRKLYDYRCAACGLRLKLGDLVVVDAAHLIPWSETHNDHPTNGIALCKNHHWAMDRFILAPGVDRKWHVSPLLDARVPDNGELLGLDGQTLFEPNEKKFKPSDSVLEWRQERLRTS